MVLGGVDDIIGVQMGAVLAATPHPFAGKGGPPRLLCPVEGVPGIWSSTGRHRGPVGTQAMLLGGEQLLRSLVDCHLLFLSSGYLPTQRGCRGPCREEAGLV